MIGIIPSVGKAVGETKKSYLHQIEMSYSNNVKAYANFYATEQLTTISDVINYVTAKGYNNSSYTKAIPVSGCIVSLASPYYLAVATELYLDGSSRLGICGYRFDGGTTQQVAISNNTCVIRVVET